jgi:hypothetical protein
MNTLGCSAFISTQFKVLDFHSQRPQPMARKIILPLISLFLAYRSVELVRVILSVQDPSLPITFVLSFLLNLFITGVFAFVGFAYPTNRLLPDAYYRISHPMALKKAYRMLGVKHFRMLLLLAYWGRANNRKRYFNGTRSGIRDLDFQTRQSEFGHVGAFVVLTLVAILLLYKGLWPAFGMTMAINIIGNLYPALLQRVHRVQIQRMTLRHGV